MIVALCIGLVSMISVPSSSAFALTLWAHFDENYNVVFSPSLSVEQVSLRILYLQPYAFSDPIPNGIASIHLAVNAMGVNSEGVPFFSGNFTFNTHADQKMVMYRTYDASLRTKTFTLYVDALLSVRFVFNDFPPIDRVWHLTFPMSFPDL